VTFLRSRLVASIQGLSPETAALVLAVGVTLGLFPIYGCPTILCALASLTLGLNIPAVQLVNQLATPLQLAMLVPFVRLGARILNSPRSASLAGGLGASALQAITGWVCVGVPLGVLLYFTLAHVLRRFESARESAPASPGSHIPRNFAIPRLARGRV
jgi:uncharacterized protein (DUF2062 family)